MTEAPMGPDGTNQKSDTLRAHLRSATAPLHDRLDKAMRPPSDWRSREEYSRFLSTQYQARIAVEQWLAINADADLKPPEQSPLIAHDLAGLGGPFPVPVIDFELQYEGTATVLGAAWVLAGSSLGNRAMLHDMHRALAHENPWPAEFLSSGAMTQFWKNLRPRIEMEATLGERDLAVRSAGHVFDHFLKVAETKSESKHLEEVR